MKTCGVKLDNYHVDITEVKLEDYVDSEWARNVDVISHIYFRIINRLLIKKGLNFDKD